MDPVSQTQASEALAVRGYSVIGWYHSHPAFDPNPSLRDIDTQAKYQVCYGSYVYAFCKWLHILPLIAFYYINVLLRFLAKYCVSDVLYIWSI